LLANLPDEALDLSINRPDPSSPISDRVIVVACFQAFAGFIQLRRAGDYLATSGNGFSRVASFAKAIEMALTADVSMLKNFD
jgi:hypothetical protein